MMTRQSSSSGVPSITASLFLLSLYVVYAEWEAAAAPVPEDDARAVKAPLPAPLHDVKWGKAADGDLSPGVRQADAPKAKPTIDVIVKPLAPLNAQTPEEIEHNAIRVVATPPKYPEQQAKEGVEGWVLVEFDISPDGTVQNAEVIESTPARVFDQSALSAVQRWKYEPKLVGGKPAYEYGVRQQIKYEVNED